MSVPPASTTARPATRSMFALGLMMAGAATVDALTANMLPITARHFTDNITLIGVMVALNRICGFLVQPYAAWKSDRHRSRAGRRRPFLLGGWPTVFGSVALLGALPFLVPEAYHRTLPLVALLFGLNLVMQAALDLCYGAGDPLYGDVFTSGDLGRANGIRMVVTSAVGLGMTFFFVPLADVHEFWPYAGAMSFLVVSFLVTRAGLRENIPAELPPRERYNPLKPLAELRDPHTRNVAICASAVLVTLALTEMLHSLFVTETLGFSKTILGGTTAAALVVSFAMPYPVGWLVDRIGPRAVLIAGFSLIAAVEAAFVFWVHDLASLTIALIAFKAAWGIVHLPIVPLMFQRAPAARRGSIFAAVQMTRAGTASAATIVAAGFADLLGSYRACYVIAGLACIVGAFAAFRLRLGDGTEPAPVPA